MGARWWWLPLAFLAGCAGGTGTSGTNLTGFGPGDSAASSAESTADSGSTSITTSISGTAGVSTTGTEEDSTGSRPADSSGGTEGSSTGDGSSSTGMVELECPQELTCTGALVLGSLSGDETSTMLNTTGADPTWVTFQVTEDNNSLSGESLSFTATLTSPAGYDFDLFVYLGNAGGTTGCGGTPDDSMSVGAVDIVRLVWGEGGIANGVDDSAWVAVEIVPKDDKCDPLQEWDLTIEGDT